MALRYLFAAALLAMSPGLLLAEDAASAESKPAADHSMGPVANEGDAHEGDAHDHPHHEGDQGGAHGDEHDAHSDAHGEGGVIPHAADPDLAIFTLIVFGLLAVVLRLTAWGPIVEGLAAREKGITDNIAEAAAKHDEAKALLAQHEAKLASAADDVREMLEEARRDAEATKGQIVAEAQAAAEAERQRAIREVEQARDTAVKQLAEQSANLSIDLAKKVIQQEITPQRQGELVNEALGRMASANPSAN